MNATGETIACYEDAGTLIVLIKVGEDRYELVHKEDGRTVSRGWCKDSHIAHARLDTLLDKLSLEH